MTILLRDDAPTDGARAIADALEDLSVIRGDIDELGGGPVDISQAIAFYVIGLSSIRDSQRVLQEAQFAGWRYLIEPTDAGTFSYADVVREDNVARFVELSRNRNADSLAEAAHLAESVAVRIEGDCEFRIVDAPAVKLACVWLLGKQQFFIPFIDGFRDSELRMSVLSEESYLAELRRRANETTEEREPPRFREQ